MTSQVAGTAPVREDFIRGMRRTAASVCVVATDGRAGLHGATVTAMCSVSADPPTLLVCLHKQSQCGQAVLKNRVFSLNVLGAQQRQIAEAFAGRTGPQGQQKFQTCAWQATANGSPAIDGAVAVFECSVDRWHLAGTHHIIIGAVLNVFVQDKAPIIYHNRSYRYPVDTEYSEAASAASILQEGGHGQI